jgi:hypothetical protein
LELIDKNNLKEVNEVKQKRKKNIFEKLNFKTGEEY